MAVKAVVAALSLFVGLSRGLASTDTITWGGDNSRAGYQTNHNMDPAVVGSSDFAQIFKTTIPGKFNGVSEQFYSQPLVYTPADGNQYVYLASTMNNVYKIDAKTGVIVAQRSLHIPFLSADLDGCVDINPTVGVTGTGVIDPATDTLYLVSKTYENQNVAGAQGRPAGRQYIHAINVNDLTERPNFPINLEGITPRNNPIRSFNGGIQHQRPALLQSGDYIYGGFGSHCVKFNFTGWVIGWHKTTGKLVERFATQGDGVGPDIKGAGLWMSGGGLASDNLGSMFFATGNGYASQLSTIPVAGRNPPTSLEEAAVHMTINGDGSLSLVDFFMPYEKQELDGADNDLGTSPLEILPSQFSCGEVKRMGVITGKTGKTYWLNLDDLGGYRNGADNKDRIIQTYKNENSVYAGAGVYPLEGGYVYINVIKFPTHVFKFSCNGGVPSFTKVADSPQNNGYTLGVGHGTTTSLNGQAGTGLVWTSDVGNDNDNLRIYNAIPNGASMTVIKSFKIPGITKFTRPVFGDGRVYITSNQGFLYGYGAPVNQPLNCSSPYDFGNAEVSATAATSKTVTCKVVSGVTVSKVAVNSSDFTVSGVPTLPATLAAGATFTFTASFKPSKVGFLSSSIVIDTTNTAAGYSKKSTVRVNGNGVSTGALLSITPTSLTFTNAVVGGGGNSQTVLFSDDGNSSLTISGIQYSTTGLSGPFVQPTNNGGGSQVGPFTFTGLPNTIAANSAASVTVSFNPTTAGTSSVYLIVNSNGGSKNLTVTGTAGPAPVALIEFQTTDMTGWVTYKPGMNFTFGNVTENTSRALKMRVTNTGGAGAVPLGLTVSKPPFGVPGIIGAANQVDLAEGTTFGPGQSGTATLFCSVPKTQWNTDPYGGYAEWTMNTNDPNFGKQVIGFACTAVAEQAAPLQSNGQGTYRYLGCYKENNPGRQLATQIYGDNTNTNAMCIAACAAKGFAYCGTQYNRECWGGPTIPTLKVDGTNCNYPCSGDLNQICGGNGVNAGAGGAYISLFATNTTGGGTGGGGNTGGGTSTTTSTTPAPTGGPFTNPGLNGYVSIGCYTESTTGRALTKGLTTTAKTVASCINAAVGQGFQYVGLEYGGECWAGNSFSAGAVPTSIGQCNMPCNDNATEYCGAGSRLNVYQRNGTSTTNPGNPSTPSGPAIKQTIGNWQRQGCWTESTTGRALTSSSKADDTMTLEMCAAFCSTNTYFGVEYGRECYCGNSLSAGSVAADDQTDCDFLCPGDKTEYCGAGSRLELYKQGASTGSSTSSLASSTSLSTSSTVSVASTGTSSPTSLSTSVSSSSSSTSVSSTSTSTTSSAVPTFTGTVVSQGNSNFSYYSCVSEPSNGRLLSNLVEGYDTMTIARCLGECYMYKYAGVEYGRECWCGNTLNLAGNNAGTPGANKTDTECNFKCPGNSTEYCGAGGRMNLYYFNPTR